MNNWKHVFKNEKDFTLRLVIPWLKSLGHQNVRYTGGNEEYGRDVIFSKGQTKGDENWTGVQVKYGKIRGKHVGNSDIQELISQTKTALSVPLAIEQGTKVIKISQSIILTNESITTNAKTILKAGLKDLSYSVMDIVDIENSFKLQKVGFSKTSVLIRTPSTIDSEISSRFKFDIYENKPSGEFHESKNDSYFDYSREFGDLIELLKFLEELEKEELEKEFIIIFLEVPPLFNIDEIRAYFRTYYLDKKFEFYEDGENVTIEYLLSRNAYSEIKWLEDVNKLQILQKK